jgi:hypothetical protein
MRAGVRLARLEAALPPQAAVLFWLAEAHQHGSLAGYVRWLSDQPGSVGPGVVIIERARAAARAAHAGEPRPAIREAERRAVADALFLFMLVIELTLHAAETVRTARLRLAALRWELRARTAEGAADRQVWAAWRAGVVELATDLDQGEAVRRLLEDRYSGRSEVIFPDTAVDGRVLREDVAALMTSAGILSGRGRRRFEQGVARVVAAEASATVQRVWARALVLGDHSGLFPKS